MISPLWRGVDRVVVACESGSGEPQLAARLCAATATNVRVDSPFPVVEGAAASAPRRDDAVLRIRMVADSADAMALSVLIERGIVIDESEAAIGGRPIAIAGGSDAALTAAVAGALHRLLPWRSPRRESSPIRPS